LLPVISTIVGRINPQQGAADDRAAVGIDFIVSFPVGPGFADQLAGRAPACSRSRNSRRMVVSAAVFCRYWRTLIQ
jgi:hypothetical protein